MKRSLPERIIIGIVLLWLSPILLPVVAIFGYPVFGGLAVGIALCIVVLIKLGESPWSVLMDRRLVPRMCLAILFLGFSMMIHGLLICMDSPLKGSPTTDEERRIGRRVCYGGAAVALVGALGAYTVDCVRKAKSGDRIALDLDE